MQGSFPKPAAMPNRLQNSSSPYLLAHAENPVEWYPWGKEALDRAKAENKPIFLSIGYSACHWCHVMERESFESPKTAEIMNKLFVNIKVDREERPDIDAIYMKAVVLMTGHGGWPTSIWLTPDLKPFFGGTYFPLTPRPGQPSFAQLLLMLGAAWKDKPDEIESSAVELLNALKTMSDISVSPNPDPTAWLERAVTVCETQYDEKAGGFGSAPKFPQAMALKFLLIRAIETDDKELLELVDHSMEAMARGGLYDQLGGGFHRYTVDSDWTVPHFEKMLYDNALLCDLYCAMYAHSGKAIYRSVVEYLVSWLGDEMTLENGGFASSQDADSDGEEGKYFVWTPAQLSRVLDENERKLFTSFYQVTPAGNFENGASVLTRKLTLSRCAKELGWDLELANSVLESARNKAMAARAARTHPHRDDKALASWNAWMVSALCRAARHLDLPQARELALGAGEFLRQHFASPDSNGNHARLVFHGASQGTALSEDFASLFLAFFDLYEISLDDRWIQAALPLFDTLLKDFWDEERGLVAMTNPRTDDLPFRPYSFEDNATPSAQSLFMECARRHYRWTGKEASRELWEAAANRISDLAQQAPTGLGLALVSGSLMGGSHQDLIVSGSETSTTSYLDCLSGRFLPNLMVAKGESPSLDPALSQGKECGKAYLCQGSTCLEPVSSSDGLKELLSTL